MKRGHVYEPFFKAGGLLRLGEADPQAQAGRAAADDEGCGQSDRGRGSMSWTRFMDMHSGGRLKEEKYALIYIEAPADEARVIFYNRFGHNPDRVTCTCCGPDYSIDEYQTVEAATAYDRGCPWVEDERGWMFRDKPADYRDGFYLEPGQQVPEGMKRSSLSSIRGGEAVTVEEWRKSGKGNIDGGVLFIDAADIKPEERVGEVPEQGYVWRD